MKARWQVMAALGALIYATAAGLWIAFSDKALGWLAGSMSIFQALSTVKGCGFVCVTSLIFYAVMRRWMRKATEAQATAEEITHRLKELQAIAEHGNQILYKHGLDHRLTYVSPQCRAILGYEQEESRVEWGQLLTSNPINQRALDFTSRAFETGERQPPYVVEARHKDGHPVLLEVDESPLKDAEERVIAMVGVARDVTERERAEQAVRDSEERFRCLAETISEVFWMADLDLKQMHYVSPAYEKVWGRSCESLSRNPGDWLKAVHPEDREQAVAAFWMDRGLKELSAEYRIVRPDGAIRWIQDRGFPLRNKAGETIGLVGVAKDITEAKLAEIALRNSEQKLRALYRSMSDGLAVAELVYDATGQPVDYRILDMNPAAEVLAGFSRNRLVGKLATQALGSGEAPELKVLATVAQTGQPVEFETFFAIAGKHFSVSAFCPRRGQVGVVFSDITKRKEAEQQICLLNRVYSLVSHINEAIVRISDRDTLLKETCRIAVEHGQFSLAWVGLLERPGGAIRPVASFGNHDGYLEDIQASAALVARSPGPTITAVQEGRVVIVQDIASDEQMAPWREKALARGYRSLISLPLKVGSQVIGALVAYATEPKAFSALVTESLIEVTTDLSFALELFERNRQREIEQQRLRIQHSALEAAANAIVITNRDGEIEFVNEAFSRLTGYSLEEALGRNPRLLKSGAHPPDSYQRMWQTILAGKVWQGVLTNKRKDGSLYEEEMTITPVRSKAGQVEHFIAIKQDITERKKLEQQFLRAQRMQSVGLLAGGVAHDLNNVLAPVLMALPLLRNDLPVQQREHILDMLEQSVRRGANIIRQVLTFARGVEVQRVLVQPRHLLREVAKIVEETFPKDIRIRCNAPASLWPLEGDPTQIHQVLLNLAVNARDAMPEGGQLTFVGGNVILDKPLQFMGFEIPPGQYVSISVTDTGTGVPPEIQERIFEPFFTTKPAGKGTGLGLSTVLGIVKSHFGLVQVESKPDLGSAFTVFLPASPAQAVAPATPQAASPPRGRGETILVVDDEAGVLQVTKSMLEAHGYQVTTARNGVQAIARFTEQGPAIKAIITDIMMPQMDGLALTRSVRNLRPDLPIVAATGLLNPPGDEDRAGQLRELGIRHFLLKPFQAEDLLFALQEALQSGGQVHSPQSTAHSPGSLESLVGSFVGGVSSQ